MESDGDGGGFIGGGIRFPASNHSILYLLSMLYHSIAASMTFSASLANF
jgi:hypothetical protein